jgi:ketosteroid isomerase-like protein
MTSVLDPGSQNTTIRHASSLLPFVPSGSDYDGSRRLFAALGFEEIREGSGFATFQSGDVTFILQRYDMPGFAENLMLLLTVPDVDAWWKDIAARDLERSFPGVRIKPPQNTPWGRTVDLVDLAGVCWHIQSRRPSRNKETIDQYMEAFRRSDHAAVLACLTDDVEWKVPGVLHLRGKEAFDKEIENPAFVGRPDITVSRLTEQAGVVIAEGTVRTERKDGTVLHLAFCDVFEMQDGKIRRLVSYLAEVSG